MKKRNLFLTVIACLLLVSCDKNENSPAVEAAPFVVSELSASDDMLSFSSMAELDRAVGSLLRMNSTEQASWYSQYSTKGAGFTSLEQIYNSAVDEFLSFVDLGIEDLSIAEEIKDKYAPYLLFNDNPEDEELYLPVLPSELFGKSLVTNKNGDVLVGGEVLNFNDVESVEETSHYKYLRMGTKNIEEKANYVHLWSRNYRQTTTAKLTFIGGYTYVDVHVQSRSERRVSGKWWRNKETTHLFQPLYFTNPVYWTPADKWQTMAQWVKDRAIDGVSHPMNNTNWASAWIGTITRSIDPVKVTIRVTTSELQANSITGIIYVSL